VGITITVTETKNSTDNFARKSDNENRNINPLTPNDPYRGRTAPLTSKISFYIFIQQI